MAIVGGMDLHRKQITFDYLDTESGEVLRAGRIAPADRARVREWLARFADRGAAAPSTPTCTNPPTRVSLRDNASSPAAAAELPHLNLNLSDRFCTEF